MRLTICLAIPSRLQPRERERTLKHFLSVSRNGQFPMCLQFADRTIVLFRSNTTRVLLVRALYNRACTNKSLYLSLTILCGSSYRGAGVFRFNTCTQSLNTRSLNQLHKTTRVLTFYSHTKRDWWAPVSQQTLHPEFRSLHVRGLWKWEVFVYSERGKL